jgi:two-component system OmpR family response regulator
MLRVLALDDDARWLTVLSRVLGREGIEIDGKTVIDEFLVAARERVHDVLLVDWNLRRCEGTTIVTQLRIDGDDRPVGLVSGFLETDHAKHLAERAGADAFIEKTISPGTWADQIRALANGSSRRSSGLYRLVDGGMLEVRDGNVVLREHNIGLRPKEYMLLEYLLAHTATDVSYDELLEHCWGVPRGPRGVAEERLLRGRVITTMNRLRSALGSAARMIQTVEGGYRIARTHTRQHAM